MSNPKKRQQWIYNLLQSNPTLSYNDCFTKYFQRFTKSRQTFTKDWKNAQERLQGYQKEVDKAITEERIKLEKQAVKREVLDKLKSKEILSKVAMGTAHKINGKIIVPSYNDRLKAISELAKFEGWYAPAKQDTTIKVEQPLFPDVTE